ncbi:MAG: PilZ domain-containing protein [Phycisphaerae bacterium]
MVTKSDITGRGIGKERRRFGRFAARLPLDTVRDDLGEGCDSPAARCRMKLRDFSLGGLRAESPVRLKRNERLTLRLPPSGKHPPLELTGRVAHCRRDSDRYQVGVEFCQTRAEPTASPWWQLPRLFSIASQVTEEGLEPLAPGAGPPRDLRR